MTEYHYLLQQWNGGASAADSSNLHPWLHQRSTKWAESNGPSHLLLPACWGFDMRVSPAPHLCVYACGSSSFPLWWTSCHSSFPCRWTASRHCEPSCEPAASAARRSSCHSPPQRNWTFGRSWRSKSKPTGLSVCCVNQWFAAVDCRVEQLNHKWILYTDVNRTRSFKRFGFSLEGRTAKQDLIVLTEGHFLKRLREQSIWSV